MPDAVDAIIDQWRRERPDVAEDLWAMAIVGRVQRLNRVLERELATFFTQHDLQNWEIDMLFTLRRAGTPLSAGALLRSAMVTSGAITNRIDRLETRGLVERIRDTGDRRSVLIRLTQGGRDLVDGVLRPHLVNEHRIFAGLSVDDREALTALLRTTLEHLGDTTLG
jgi:DNA-binding MarR family transcriptional regulator